MLRSFRSDLLSKAVLALLLGTFTYSLALLVRLGAQESGVPNLSPTLALALALVSFTLFAVFIGHIASMLQPSTGDRPDRRRGDGRAGRADAGGQAEAIGDYVIPGQLLAEVWLASDDAGPQQARERLRSGVRDAFVLGRPRSLAQDIAFPVRQLADIALKGLSPGINDPTTAENAIAALAAVLVRLARSRSPCEVRVDDPAARGSWP